MIGGFFGKTANGAGKAASTGTKGARAASHASAAKGLSTAGKTAKSAGAAKKANTANTANTAKTAAQHSSNVGKIQRPGAIKDGQLQGGLWDGLRKGEIELGSSKPYRLADLRSAPSMTGRKLVDGLGDPKSGLEQLTTRVEQPDSMFQNMWNGRGGWSQAEEARDSIRTHFR
jgi:hypothetical protein